MSTLDTGSYLFIIKDYELLKKNKALWNFRKALWVFQFKLCVRILAVSAFCLLF